MKQLAILFILISSMAACGDKKADLPTYQTAEFPGVYTDQNGKEITASDLKGKVIVTDFVFTHCPSICPKMAQQMKRVQTEFEKSDDLIIASFSIDPIRDTVGRLKWYSDKIGANDKIWRFLRADIEVINKTSENLMVFQEEDENAPGGFNHQSRFILIDKDGVMRGFYNGIDPEDVDELIEDMHQLL